MNWKALFINLKKRTAVAIVLVMVLQLVPFTAVDIGAADDLTEQTSEVALRAASGTDPLESVATVTTGGSVSSFVEINSNYTPAGYYTPATQSDKGYTSGPVDSSNGPLSSYHTDTWGKNENKYLVTTTNDLAWVENGANNGISGVLQATSTSDYVAKSCGVGTSNGAMCAKVNSKVIMIKALADISISFDWSVSMKMTKWQGDKAGSIQEGFYVFISTNPEPTIQNILTGTAISSKKLTENSPTEAADSGMEWTTALEEGQYLFLYFYGFFNNEISLNSGSDKYTFSASINNFKVTPVTESYTLNVGNRDCANNLIGGGKINVNNTPVTIPASGTAVGLNDVLSGTNAALSLPKAQVPSGYFHIGWQVNGNNYFEETYEVSLSSNTTVFALLIPQVTVDMGNNGYSDAVYSYKNPSGTTITGADQYIARNSASTEYYKTLSEAFASNDVVVLLGNIVMNGNFTIPNGKTLSIQRGWNDSATTELKHEAGSEAASVFSKATINGTLTLEGNLVASANQSNTDSVNGRANGGVGQFIVNGTINVGNGGKLYAYGMFTGPGQINVASGGKVYELMEIRDMRSIYVLSTVVSGGAFPLNHFFIKTNEVTTTYSKGANLTGYYCVSVSGIKSTGEVPVVGSYSTSSESFFMINNGTLTKSFNSASPYNNKIIFRAENGSDIRTGKFSITISTPMGSYNIDTKNFVLPLNYCYAIEVMSGGSLSLRYDYKLLPGALVDVKEGGTLTIENGKKVYLYRANDYNYTARTGFSYTAYPTSFTKPTGLSYYASNTFAKLGSAKLIVDGTLNVTGGLYVTNQLSEKSPYANGYNYLTGTGVINYTGAVSNGTIKEWVESGSGNSSSASSVNIACVPIKGITNYNATTDDGQTDYNSLSQTTWYGWINDNNVNVWTTSLPVTLSYHANGGTGTAPASSKVPMGTSKTVAANTFTAPANMVFNGWNTAADGSGTAYSAGASIPVSANTVLYAQWTLAKYTVTWIDGNGNTLKTEQVEYGVTPAYTGDTPTKTATAQYTYTFNETWSPAVVPVAGDATYTAQFDSTVNKYTITWKNEDGSVIDTTTVAYGVKPTHANPTKTGDAQYEYTFTGWTPEVVAVTADATYTATFTSVLRSYTITWNNEDGTLIDTTTVAYGVKPTHANPTKTGDAQYEYTFTGWTPEVVAVTGDAEYTATFTQELRSYTITWKNGDTVLETDENVPYGTMPSYDGAIPTKTDKEYTYTFTGWDPAVSAVTGDATYTAQFTATAKIYRLTFKYQLSTEDKEYSATIKYTYPAKISTPKIQYYNLDKWELTAGGVTTEYATAEELTTAIRNAIDAANTDAELENITVKAFFERMTYRLEIHSVKVNSNNVREGDPTYENLYMECFAGRTYWINASDKLDGDYKFDHWEIEGVAENDKNQRTSYWRADGNGVENTVVKAIAVYKNGGTGVKATEPRVTVRDYFVENNDGVCTIGMTLEVIAPEDMTNYAIVTDTLTGKLHIGFGYTPDKDKAGRGEFSEVLSSNWDNAWRSGTYVMRMKLTSEEIYSCGLIEYTTDGGTTKKFMYATDGNPSATALNGNYDTLTQAGLQKKVEG